MLIHEVTPTASLFLCSSCINSSWTCFLGIAVIRVSKIQSEYYGPSHWPPVNCTWYISMACMFFAFKSLKRILRQRAASSACAVHLNICSAEAVSLNNWKSSMLSHLLLQTFFHLLHNTGTKSEEKLVSYNRCNYNVEGNYPCLSFSSSYCLQHEHQEPQLCVPAS